MNHRPRRAGYHSRWAPCRAALALLAAAIASPGGAAPWPGDPRWEEARAATVAHINAARAAHGLAPLQPDGALARLGDRHCLDLLEDGVVGHFSRRGTPPYLRYLLAGGTGFHRQNAAAYVGTAPLTAAEVVRLLRESVDRMLAEEPPHDGHRRTLLDPTSTHLGVGLGVAGGTVVATHEVTVEIAREVLPPPAVALPRSPLTYALTLPPPWQVRAVELLWEPLPGPLTAAQANAVSAYGYPPRRAIIFATSRMQLDRGGPLMPGAGRLTAEGRGRLTYRWTTAPAGGVEVLVVWAAPAATVRNLTPVAAAAVVVTPDGTLPPELGRWVELRRVGHPAAAPS